jgi:hypothetical protein
MDDQDSEATKPLPEFAEEPNGTLSEGEQAYRQAARYLRFLNGKEVPAEELAGVVSRLTALLDQQPHNERIVQLLYLAIARARPSTEVTAGASLTATAVISAALMSPAPPMYSRLRGQKQNRLKT